MYMHLESMKRRFCKERFIVLMANKLTICMSWCTSDLKLIFSKGQLIALFKLNVSLCCTGCRDSALTCRNLLLDEPCPCDVISMHVGIHWRKNTTTANAKLHRKWDWWYNICDLSCLKLKTKFHLKTNKTRSFLVITECVNKLWRHLK